MRLIIARTQKHIIKTRIAAAVVGHLENSIGYPFFNRLMFPVLIATADRNYSHTIIIITHAPAATAAHVYRLIKSRPGGRIEHQFRDRLGPTYVVVMR